MARKSTSERFEEAMKRAKGGSNTTKGTSSSTTKKSKEDRFEEAMKNAKTNRLRDSIGLDTFDSDLARMNDTINKVYSGWHDSDYMANTKNEVSAMQNRLQNYRKYVNSTHNGDLKDFNKQVDDILFGYSSALNDWDNLTNIYSGYKDAESYTKETNKLRDLNNMTTEELKAKLDSEESPYAYTTQSGQDITWESLYKDKLHKEMATSEEGAEGWQKYLADTEAKKASESESLLDIWASSSTYDMTTPGGMLSYVVDQKRKDKSYMMPTDEWTDEERNIFGAYYLTDTAKAYEYATEVNNAKNLEKEKKQKGVITDSATSNGWAGTGHTALSILSAPLGLADYLDDLTSFAAGKPIMSDGFVSPFEYSQTVQSGISTHLNEKGGTLNEKIPVIGGKGWGDVYGLGTSIAQSVASKPLGAAGVLMSYFGQGAASGVDDALSRGATDGQALLYGSSVGALEGALEAAVDIKFKNLGASSTAKVLGSKMLEQGANEAAEEGLTTLLGNVADAIIMRDKSAFNNAVRTHEANGEKNPIGKALLEVGEDIIYDALGGFVSGGVQAGPKVLSNTSQLGSTVRENNNIEELGSLASELNSDGFKKYIDAIEKGNISNLQLGSLYEAVSNETKNKADKSTADSIMRTVADRAIELGDTQNSGIIASAIQKNMQGQKLSAEEKSALKSDTAQIIMKEIKKDGLGIKISDEMKSASNIYERTEAVYTTKDATKGKKIGNQTVDNKSGAEINIEGMSLDNDGNMVLETSEGTRSVDDITVTYADSQMLDIAKEYEADVKGKGDLFASLYDGKTDIKEYKASFDMMYNHGELATGDQNITQHMGVLNANQAIEIYKSGLKNSTVIQQNKVDKVVAAYRKENPGFKEGTFDDSKVNYKNLTKTQKSYVAFTRDFFTKFTGANVVMYESFLDEKGNRVMKNDDGTVRKAPNGWYDASTNSIYLDVHAGIDERNKAFESGLITTLSHETTHWMKEKSPTAYKNLTNAVMNALAEAEGKSIDELIMAERGRLSERDGKLASKEAAIDELVARACEDMLGNSERVHDYLARMDAETRHTFVEKVRGIIQKLKKWMSELLGAYKSGSAEAQAIRKMAENLDNIEQLWSEAFMQAIETNQAMQNTESAINEATEKVGVAVDLETESASPSVQMSERTWTHSEYVQNREIAIKNLSKALGVSEKKAAKYIDSINSVARLIADDRVRLDYAPNLDDTASVMKPNSDYKWSIDMSTLCAKRLLFTGTFDAIQKRLPNTALDSDDIVNLRKMMMDKGYQVACGICYVESTRREIGTITADFIEKYKESQKTGKPITRTNSEGKVVDLKKTKEQLKTTADKTTDKFYAEKDYTPTLAELNTTDIDIVKKEHPLVYEAYLNYMNARGQSKPKLLETRAEYKGEIAKKFARKKDGTINKSTQSMNDFGGLRLQSFSDFEIAHLIDMMQVVMDMSNVGLMSQAYTKVPEFAEVFGGTGVKINLSLIAKGSGLDANGELIFDDVEGIDHKKAFELRNKYSKNVGTILVGKNDSHIIKAMADDRIDYIIPFHKSSWKESLYDALGLTGYADYTDTQHEKSIDPDRKISDFMPSEYWDFSKSGDENAQIYLEKCKADGRIPKFPQFQGYKGYWKLLIDFKMYDNDGVGSPQTVVRPEFDMEASERILNGYEGGHRSFPVAEDIVDKFVDDYKQNHPQIQYADRVEYVDDVTQWMTNRAWKDVNRVASENVRGEANVVPKTRSGDFIIPSGDELVYTRLNKNDMEDIEIHQIIRVDVQEDSVEEDTYHQYVFERFVKEYENERYENTSIEEFGELTRLIIKKMLGREVDIKIYSRPNYKSNRQDGLVRKEEASRRVSYHFGDEQDGSGSDSESRSVIQNSDRAYMEAVNSGDMETAQKMVDEKAKELGARVFPNGKLINYYHGTNENFTSFDIEKAKHGVYGFGFYFSPMRSKAENYTSKDGRLISAYIFTDKLATHDDYTLKAEDVKKVLNDFGVPIDEQEQLWHGYESIEEWLKDDSDRIALQEIEKRIYRNSDASVKEILNAFRTVFGYDGIQANNETILFDNKLIKSAEPVTYDDEGNVIPLSKRFNTENEDIRYSDRTTPIADDDYKNIVKHFGTTGNFNVAGYMLQDGKMLDFSGKHWGDTTSRMRQVDHRDIQEVISDENNGVDSMVRMISNGNIRLMPEDGGINLAVTPSKNQRTVLRRYIEYFKGEVTVDIDEVGGDTIESFRYDRGTSADRVMRDIDNYFKGGRQSDLMRFHTMYSDRDTQSAYEILDENRRYESEVDKIITDHKLMQKKMEIEKKYTKVTPNYEQLSSEASMLIHHVGSAYDKVVLAKELKSVYKGIQSGEDWNITMGKLMDIAEGVLKTANETIDLTDSYADVVINKYIENEAKWHLAVEMYNRLWNIYPVKTMSEKHRNDIKQLKAEHRRELDLLNLRKSWMAAKDKNELRKKVTKAREDALEEGKKRFEEYKEKDKRRSKINAITKKALTLNEWLVKNNKDKHIPEPMKDAVIQLIASIDFSSKQMLSDTGKKAHQPTKKDISINHALAGLRKAAEDIKKGEAEAKENGSVYLDLDLPDSIVETIGALIDRTNNLAKQYGDATYVLNHMTYDELDSLDEVITILKGAISKANKSFVLGQNMLRGEIAKRLIEFSNGLSEKKMDNDATAFLEYKNTTPYYMLKRLGPEGERIFNALMDAQDKLVFIEDEIERFVGDTVNAEKIKEWSEEIHEFTIKGILGKDKKIQMTTAQMMSLYCLNERDAAKLHLEGGGIRMTDIKVNMLKTIKDHFGTSLSSSDLANILSTLTKEQKDVAIALRDFMSTRGSDLGNEVTLARWDIKQLVETKYFPMDTVAQDGNLDNIGNKENSIYRLLNMNFMKSLTPNANNQLIIDNIFDVFTRHMTEMAKYNAFALPLLDTLKVLGYSEKVFLEEGSVQHETISVAKSIKRAFGQNGYSYIVNLLKDLNGAEVSPRDESIPKTLMANYKIASVGNNLRVMALQGTAYVKASLVMDGKYLAKAIATNPLDGIEKAMDNSGIALWKSKGHYDINISRSTAKRIKHDESLKDKIVDLSMKGAEWGDKLTWGYLWNACELWAKDNTAYKHGSEEFNKAVSNKLREIIVRTQVVDSTLTRSQMMRDKSAMVQTLTAFMSESTMTYNYLSDAFFEWSLDARKDGNSYKSTFTKHGKNFAKSVGVFTLSAFATALSGAFFDALRDDDEEKEFDEKYLENLLEALGDNLNVFSTLPILKDIVSIAKGYSPSRFDEQSFTNLYQAYRQWVKVVEGDGNVYKASYKTLQGMSQLTGLPISNLVRDVVAMWNSTIGEVYPSLKIEQ